MKILVKIKDSKLEFINRKKLNSEYKNMLNTNIINDDELVFSDDYIKDNSNIFLEFINGLSKSNGINTVLFQNNEVANLLIDIILKIKPIENLYFDSSEVLPYKICEKIAKSKNIRYISAEYIPQYMFELLDKYNIIPESRNEILFTSKFMELNSLDNYSSIYYKYTIYINLPLLPEDYLDLEMFLKINKNLKVINVINPNIINIQEIIEFLNDLKRKNIRINIRGDVQDNDVINYLKNNKKKFKRKNKLSFRIDYSKNFIENNIVKETNNTILKYISIFILCTSIFLIGYICFDNYKSMLDTAKIQKEIDAVIDATDPEEIIENIEKDANDKPVINKYIASLTTVNTDAVGWLKVNNTNIDYAILQTTNNEYYLNYNIYNEKDPNGWLFMDFENDTKNVDDNVIIYGHNRFVNGVMFGTLHKTLYKGWYTNPENQIISFDTMFGSYNYKIFSIYIVNTTTDYLKTNFDNVEEKKEFLNSIKSRSIYDFGIELDENSKILTLSTCQSDTSRLVVHGVLQEENKD